MERAVGVCVSLCALWTVQPVTHQLSWAGGAPGHRGQRTPAAPKQQPNCILLAPNKMKKKKELIFSCPWLFSSKLELIQCCSFPDTMLYAPEHTWAFVLGCESAFCMSPSTIRVQFPAHSHAMALPTLLLFSSFFFHLFSQNCWGLTLALPVCWSSPSRGHQSLTPPR